MSEAGDIDLGWETLKSLIAKFIQAALGFAGIVIFTRIVGKSDFGGYFLLFSIAMIVDRPVRGLGVAINKRWSEAGAPRRELTGTIFSANLFLVVIGGIGAYLFRSRLVSYTGLDGASLLFVVLLGAIGTFTLVQQTLGAEGYPGRQTWIDTFRSVLTLPFQVALILAGMGALGMGYGLVAATVLCLPLNLWFIWKGVAFPSRTTLASLWEYARYSIPSAFVGKAYDRFDVILLGLLVGTVSVANYEVALKLTIPAGFMSLAIGSALMPKISNNISRGREFIPDIEHSISYISILSIPVFFGVLAIPEVLVVTAFDQQYRSAAPYLVGLALYRVFSTQTTVYRRTLSGMDDPRSNLYIGVITLGVNIVLGIILIITMGPLGVVVATILAEMCQYSLSAYYVRQKIPNLTLFPRQIWEQVGAGVLIFVVVRVVRNNLSVQSFIDTAVLVGIGGAVYGVTLLAISPNIRLTARSIYHDAVQ